ncbi:MAG: hypothetical protein IPF47_18080 [Gemmatimonadetes bacterium]|nr:hypothetical protein [Gemmatimonadota bacterium]
MGATSLSSTTPCSITWHSAPGPRRSGASPRRSWSRWTAPDLHIGGLADYLDGREKLVLVVRGASPPAPLVRLITPGTMVLQTSDDSGLDLVATTSGTAVAALVPAEAARFLHDPAQGREPWQRLTVWHMPPAPKNALGGLSAWQMQEDLRQLEALAAGPTATAAAGRGARWRERRPAPKRWTCWPAGC